MIASNRTARTLLVWTTAFWGLFLLTSVQAKVTVVTLSELVNESDTIVYGSFKSSSRVAAQSPSFVQFVPRSILRGKDLSTNGPITFCNASGEAAPDLSKVSGELVLFATKRLECFGLAHGNKSIIRVKAGRARTAAMDDQPLAQPLATLLKKIRLLVAKQPAT